MQRRILEGYLAVGPKRSKLTEYTRFFSDKQHNKIQTNSSPSSSFAQFDFFVSFYFLSASRLAKPL